MTQSAYDLFTISLREASNLAFAKRLQDLLCENGFDYEHTSLVPFTTISFRAPDFENAIAIGRLLKSEYQDKEIFVSHELWAR